MLSPEAHDLILCLDHMLGSIETEDGIGPEAYSRRLPIVYLTSLATSTFVWLDEYRHHPEILSRHGMKDKYDIIQNQILRPFAEVQELSKSRETSKRWSRWSKELGYCTQSAYVLEAFYSLGQRLSHVATFWRVPVRDSQGFVWEAQRPLFNQCLLESLHRRPIFEQGHDQLVSWDFRSQHQSDFSYPERFTANIATEIIHLVQSWTRAEQIQSARSSVTANSATIPFRTSYYETESSIADPVKKISETTNLAVPTPIPDLVPVQKMESHWTYETPQGKGLFQSIKEQFLKKKDTRKRRLSKEHLPKEHLSKEHLPKEHLSKEHLSKEHLPKAHLPQKHPPKDEF
ncbi:hypothetical protein BT63DRAFT_416254 [Microthyrium microscopicum]|uniref:Uncharacterized protein n=1 Tax=Microthyrium microscopicum TaxID=703497 RepID=A0A6A6U6I6_9PEZI|nr:hypothetical protein BT63DRAFT_416254 [Microthyrium microscopicum]